MTDVRDGVAGLVVALPFLLGAAAAPVDTQREVFSFVDPDINEASGLAVVDGLFVTVNDSGDTGRVFTVDPDTGETVGTTRWEAEAVDVEALAPGGGSDGSDGSDGSEGGGTVWVGDIGDNLARRDSVTVRQVPVGPGEQVAGAPSYELVYADGAHDAEALLRHPTTGRLYVATKALLGGTLYAAPERLDPDAPNELTPVGLVPPIVTDGAFLPDGEHLVLRDYTRAVVLSWPSLEQVDTTPLPAQEQGEAIAVDATGGAFVTSEGVGAAVLAVDVPVPAVAAATTAAPSSAPSASPTRAPTESREDRELPESTQTERSAWPWFISGWIGLGFLVLLLRSMRRPDRR